MALEQEQRVTFGEGSENRILESEEVKITPPARRRKAEKMKNKVGSKPPLPSEGEEVMTSDCSSNTELVELSLKQGEDVERLNKDISPQGDGMNFESHETKNGVLRESCTEKDSANEARAKVLSCVENSSVEPNDLAAYANETNSVQSSNEGEAVKEDVNLVSERKDDLESPVGFEISPKSCTSLNISASANQDEESFFSADEAETSRELQPFTLLELTETVNETELERALSVNSENTNTRKETGILDEERCQETPQSLIANCCDQRSAFEVSKESLDSSSTSGLQESAKEPLSTEPSVSESSNSEYVSEPVTVDDQDSHLSVDRDLGATGAVLESDSDTDEEWSSSSYTSSEGEYDVGFAEVVRGLEEVSSLQVTNDLCLLLISILKSTHLHKHMKVINLVWQIIQH